jgi:vitamin B12 transporter|tara:strand:+ start:97 stop:2004 length:1908 start_codon:yes stop_codon:yes gene_type:complete
MSYLRNICLLTALISTCNIYAEELLPPITVTASRSAIPINQVSGALTIISEQEIEQQNAVYVSDLLQTVPSLNVSTQGSAGSVTQIRIRGSESNHVLVVIDGVEVNDPANASEFNFAHLLANNIERIEILRGPQSSLWGSDALAGVINITTKRANTGQQFIASSSYGSNNNSQAGLNYLLGSEKFNLVLSGNFIDTDGFNSATTGHERDGYDNTTLNLKTEYQIRDNINIGASTRYTNASNEFDPAPLGVPIDGVGKNDTEQFYARGFIKWHTFNDHWVHVAEASMIDTSNDSFDSSSGRSKSEATKEKFSFQSTIHLPAFETMNLNQSLTLALEREQERFKQLGASSPGFDPNQHQKTTNVSRVAEYRTNFLEQWTLSASFRHDDLDNLDNQNTYRVGINYLHPSTNTKTYITHATGAKNPNFTEQFGFAPNNFIGNPNLKTETSESWEIGLSKGFFDDRLHFQSALFWEDLIDEIKTVFLPSFESTVINNDSRSERNGLELSLYSQLTNSLSASGSYTYLDASEPDASGNNRTEIRRPKNQWSGQVDYSFMDNKTNLNVIINHIGDRRDIDFSTGDRLTLDDYTLVNVSMNYQYNNTLKLFARVNNLLDEEYQDVFGFETSDISALAGIEIRL